MANVEVLYDAKARLGEGPCYDHVTEELVFVDILAKTVNFLNVETRQIRFYTCTHIQGSSTSLLYIPTRTFKIIVIMTLEVGPPFSVTVHFSMKLNTATNTVK